MRYRLTCGPISRPVRCVVYGEEGIGKSTFAAQAPDPVFIDVEGGTDQLPVARLPHPPSWDVLIDEARAVAEGPRGIGTLVIDTLDAAEALCASHICEHAKPRKPSVESWGYGKGYVFLADEFKRLLTQLDKVVAAGVNVICVSHAKISKFERPDELGAYDRFEMKLTKHVAPLVKEWCDLLLFLDYKTYVSAGDNGKAKASGGQRVMRTAHTPSWDAKNRFGLPETMDVDFAGLVGVFDYDMAARGTEASPEVAESAKGGPQGAAADELVPTQADGDMAPPERAGETPGAQGAGRGAELRELMRRDGVALGELQDVVVARGYQPEGTTADQYGADFLAWLVDQWPNVLRAIELQRIPVPFDA